MKPSDFALDDETLDRIFDREEFNVRDQVFEGYPEGIEQPTLVLIGGQPGAGKSHAIQSILRSHPDELVPLSGDDLRPFHPDFEVLSRDHPWLMPNATAQASGAWVRRCLNYALEKRHSLLFEGVFRDPLTVVQTADRFANANYRVEVVGLAVPYRESLLATLGRYLHPSGSEAAPRWTPTSAHDNAYRMIPSTLQAAEDSPSPDVLRVTNRNAEYLHTNTRTPSRQWRDPTPGAAVVAAQRERNAPPGPQEVRRWLQSYLDHTAELTHRGQVNDTTRSTLERLAVEAERLVALAYPHDTAVHGVVSARREQFARAHNAGPGEVTLEQVRLPEPPPSEGRSIQEYQQAPSRRAALDTARLPETSHTAYRQPPPSPRPTPGNNAPHRKPPPRPSL
ncbi:zeta toxin family protein (plasmid) [Thermobifida halotolerans]|uniref:UDP-N-acetylglucosamine kinase n=1 Tax=Thermobifida halotolerans TaxID=483545 RepID=A0AA97M271_9ACTN|nr:zeta toxin family protein [Thermobifida halotolerans]UOE22281.1 zeta toxin family protein [Thermobifida halotolerans]